jgi:tmRNA-binding protein
MIINLPFKDLAIKKMLLHKKHVMAIYAEEAREGSGAISALYWDGKKYKYQPLGMSME